MVPDQLDIYTEKIHPHLYLKNYFEMIKDLNVSQVKLFKKTKENILKTLV